jgi:hypothetical protein
VKVKWRLVVGEGGLYAQWPGPWLVTPTLQLPCPSSTLSQVRDRREPANGVVPRPLLSHYHSSSLRFIPASRSGLSDVNVALLRLRSDVVS